ncbi:MAG: restriction endonuclease subunit S, partial [Lachnospiraceae bacterium]|nr:restriction endonuclease subunit S [Lachnospiraceae bacterium]
MREMKDSGIEWIGEIGKNIKLVPLKYLLSSEEDNIKVGPFGSQLTGNDFVEDGYWVYNQRSVIDNNYKTNNTNISEDKYQLMRGFQVQTDDILITTRGTIGKISRVPLKHKEGIIHPCIIKFRIDEKKICYSLLQLLFNYSDFVEKQILYKSNATTIEVIYSETLKNIYIPVPTTVKQLGLAQFLEKKCVQIDAIYLNIKSQIDILEQYKQSVITEVVTKGLNTNVKMKDSGIEWIGQIPAHWKLHPLYFYFVERKNRNTRGKENNLLSLSYGRVIRKDINANGGLLPENFNTYNIVEDGDIIIRPTDLQNDKRSLRTGLVKEHGIITSAYIDLMPIRHIDTRYFHYLLHSYDIMKVFYNMGNGVRQGLNFSGFSRLMVFEPSYKEQVLISDYLDEKIREIDVLIDSKKEQLT